MISILTYHVASYYDYYDVFACRTVSVLSQEGSLPTPFSYSASLSTFQSASCLIHSEKHANRFFCIIHQTLLHFHM